MADTKSFEEIMLEQNLKALSLYEIKEYYDAVSSSRADAPILSEVRDFLDSKIKYNEDSTVFLDQTKEDGSLNWDAALELADYIALADSQYSNLDKSQIDDWQLSLNNLRLKIFSSALVWGANPSVDNVKEAIVRASLKPIIYNDYINDFYDKDPLSITEEELHHINFALEHNIIEKDVAAKIAAALEPDIKNISPAMMAKNDHSLDNVFATDDYNDFSFYPEIEQLIGRIEVKEPSDEKNGEIVTLEDKQKQGQLNTLLQAAIMRATKATNLNPSFLIANPTASDQLDEFKNTVQFEFVKSLMIANLNDADIAAADEQKKAYLDLRLSDLENGGKLSAAAVSGKYVPAVSQAIEDFYADINNPAKSIAVDSRFIAADVKAAEFEGKTFTTAVKAKSQKIYSAFKNFHKAKVTLQSFIKMAKSKDIWNGVGKSLLNSKYSTLTSIGIGAVTIGTMMTGTAAVAAGAAAVYGAWTTANAAISPVIDDCRNDRREYERQNGKLSFWGRIKYSFGKNEKTGKNRFGEKLKAKWNSKEPKDKSYKKKVIASAIVGSLGSVTMGLANNPFIRYAYSPVISGTVSVFAQKDKRKAEKELATERNVAAYNRYQAAKSAADSAHVATAFSAGASAYFGAQNYINYENTIESISGTYQDVPGIEERLRELPKGDILGLQRAVAAEYHLDKGIFNLNKIVDNDSISSEQWSASLDKIASHEESKYFRAAEEILGAKKGSVEEQLTKVADTAKETVASQDSIQHVASQDSIQHVASQDSIQTVASQDSIQHVASQDSIQHVASQDSIQHVASQDSIQHVAAQDSIQHVASQDSIQHVAAQDSIQTVASQDSIQNVASQDSIQNVASQDSIQNVAAQDSTQHVASQDSIQHVASQDSIPGQDVNIDQAIQAALTAKEIEALDAAQAETYLKGLGLSESDIEEVKNSVEIPEGQETASAADIEKALETKLATVMAEQHLTTLRDADLKAEIITLDAQNAEHTLKRLGVSQEDVATLGGNEKQLEDKLFEVMSAEHIGSLSEVNAYADLKTEIKDLNILEVTRKLSHLGVNAEDYAALKEADREALLTSKMWQAGIPSLKILDSNTNIAGFNAESVTPLLDRMGVAEADYAAIKENSAELIAKLKDTMAARGLLTFEEVRSYIDVKSSSIEDTVAHLQGLGADTAEIEAIKTDKEALTNKLWTLMVEKEFANLDAVDAEIKLNADIEALKMEEVEAQLKNLGLSEEQIKEVKDNVEIPEGQEAAPAAELEKALEERLKIEINAKGLASMEEVAQFVKLNEDISALETAKAEAYLKGLGKTDEDIAALKNVSIDENGKTPEQIEAEKAVAVKQALDNELKTTMSEQGLPSLGAADAEIKLNADIAAIAPQNLEKYLHHLGLSEDDMKLIKFEYTDADGNVDEAKYQQALRSFVYDKMADNQKFESIEALAKDILILDNVVALGDEKVTDYMKKFGFNEEDMAKISSEDRAEALKAYLEAHDYIKEDGSVDVENIDKSFEQAAELANVAYDFNQYEMTEKDLANMEAYAAKIFGSVQVQLLKEAYEGGKIPGFQGMPFGRFVDAMARSNGFPAVKAGRDVVFKIIADCDGFTLTKEDVKAMQETVAAFEYVKNAKVTYQVIDANGDTCSIEQGRWGQYIGKGANGVRTVNQLAAAEIEVDCGKGVKENLTIHSTGYTCGGEKVVALKVPEVETPVVTVQEAKDPEFIKIPAGIPVFSGEEVALQTGEVTQVPAAATHYLIPGDYGNDVHKIGVVNKDLFDAKADVQNPKVFNTEGANDQTLWLLPSKKEGQFDAYMLRSGKVERVETLKASKIGEIRGIVGEVDQKGELVSSKGKFIVLGRDNKVRTFSFKTSRVDQDIINSLEEHGQVVSKKADDLDSKIEELIKGRKAKVTLEPVKYTSEDVIQASMQLNMEEGQLNVMSSEPTQQEISQFKFQVNVPKLEAVEKVNGQYISLEKMPELPKFDNHGIVSYSMLTDKGIVHGMEVPGVDGKPPHVYMYINDLHDKPNVNITPEDRAEAYKKLEGAIIGHKQKESAALAQNLRAAAMRHTAGGRK